MLRDCLTYWSCITVLYLLPDIGVEGTRNFLANSSVWMYYSPHGEKLWSLRTQASLSLENREKVHFNNFLEFEVNAIPWLKECYFFVNIQNFRHSFYLIHRFFNFLAFRKHQEVFLRRFFSSNKFSNISIEKKIFRSGRIQIHCISYH